MPPFRRPRSATSDAPESRPAKSSRPGAGFGRGKKAPLTTEQAVYEYAVGALARRAKTVAQLRRQLRQRVEPGEAGAAFIEAALTRLTDQGYLSDVRFAQGYAGARVTQSRLGPRRVAQELLQKGIQPELVQHEVAAAFAETDEVTQARAFLAKKRVRPPTDQKDAARIFRLLARAGFGGGTAVKVLRLLRAGPDAAVTADLVDLDATPDLD